MTSKDVESSKNEGELSSSRSDTSIASGSSEISSIFSSSSMKEKDEEELKKEWGVTPVVKTDTNTLTYGLYPQTHVNDETIISRLNSLASPRSNGWYLYNDAYYTKSTAKNGNAGVVIGRFYDGVSIISGETYWYKCEPIEWKILTASSGSYSLVSSFLLNTQKYLNGYNDRAIDGETVHASNYKHSDVRAWLNADFYNEAFNLGNSLIQTVNIDNSHDTTYQTVKEDYCCENTDDKVYLLSYAEYMNTNYFANDETRYCKPTDYALAHLAFNYKNDENINHPWNGNGSYWTRSPAGSYWEPFHIKYDGTASEVAGGLFMPDRVDTCVRPGITINIVQ